MEKRRYTTERPKKLLFVHKHKHLLFRAKTRVSLASCPPSFSLSPSSSKVSFSPSGSLPFHEKSMSRPLDHDHTGLTERSPMESLIFKETELRLGLPGSDPPERKLGASLFSGLKRGFSDANIGDGDWVFSLSEADLGKKGSVLFTALSGLENPSETVPQASEAVKEKKAQVSADNDVANAKAQVVGWPPIRSFRKNTMATNLSKNGDDSDNKTKPECLYVKVSMDGAPYLRKVDLKMYNNYTDLSAALEKMFSCFTIGQCSSDGVPGRDGLSERCLMDLLHGSEYVLTYEDKDGDWMLVGDVPWEMFTDSCKRLRIMKGSEAIGLAPKAMEKCKSTN